MKNRDFNTVSKTANASADANFGRCYLRHSLVPPESACPLGSTDRQFPPPYTLSIILHKTLSASLNGPSSRPRVLHFA